jgi:hypothetical protein
MEKLVLRGIMYGADKIPEHLVYAVDASAVVADVRAAVSLKPVMSFTGSVVAFSSLFDCTLGADWPADA